MITCRDLRLRLNLLFIRSSLTIIQKRTIGDNSVIRVGAVVTNNIPGNVLAVGVPVAIKHKGYDNTKVFSSK